MKLVKICIYRNLPTRTNIDKSVRFLVKLPDIHDCTFISATGNASYSDMQALQDCFSGTYFFWSVLCLGRRSVWKRPVGTKSTASTVRRRKGFAAVRRAAPCPYGSQEVAGPAASRAARRRFLRNFERTRSSPRKKTESSDTQNSAET